MQFDVDVDNATLIRRGSITLQDKVQEAWPQPIDRRFTDPSGGTACQAVYEWRSGHRRRKL